MKYQFPITIILLSIFILKTNTLFAQDPCLQIGDEYQGGIIFYIDETGEHGFIAAPSDIETEAESWGCYGNTNPIAQNTQIGTGLQNTQSILANCNQPNTGAKLCAELELNGYNDWYLPSINELELIYLHRNVIGQFNNFEFPVYMSSSEHVEENNAYYRCFHYDFSTIPLIGNSRKVLTQKDNGGLVRPIRSF